MRISLPLACLLVALNLVAALVSFWFVTGETKLGPVKRGVVLAQSFGSASAGSLERLSDTEYRWILGEVHQGDAYQANITLLNRANRNISARIETRIEVKGGDGLFEGVVKYCKETRCGAFELNFTLRASSETTITQKVELSPSEDLGEEYVIITKILPRE